MSVKDVKDAAPAIAVTTEPELGAVEPFVIRSIDKGELVHVARDGIYFTVYRSMVNNHFCVISQ